MAKNIYRNLYLDKGITIALVGNDKALLSQKANKLIENDINYKKSLETENILVIKPENGNIGINEVKKAYDFFLHKPLSGNKKYLLIQEVEKFTIPGANSFLKILEEPPDFVTIILTSTSWENVLKTIRSRALYYRIKFPYEKLGTLKKVYLNDVKYIYSLCFNDFQILNFFLKEERLETVQEIRELKELSQEKIIDILNIQEDSVDEIILKKASLEILFSMIWKSGKISYHVDYLSEKIRKEYLFDFLINFSKLTRDILSDFLTYFYVKRSDLIVYKSFIEDVSAFNPKGINLEDILWCDRIAKLKVSSYNKKLILFKLINVIVNCSKGEV